MSARKEDGNLIVDIEVQINDAITKKTLIYNNEHLDMFMSHGAMLIFQRIYIITSAESTNNFTNLDSKGFMCNVICVRELNK